MVSLLLDVKEAYRPTTAQNDTGGRRAGQGERKLTQSLIFLHVPGIDAAGTAESIFAASFQVKITEIFIVQERAAALISPKALLFPVYFILQADSHRSRHMPVFFQGHIINLDLPSGTAGVRAGAADTVKRRIIMGSDILHGDSSFLSKIVPFVNLIYYTSFFPF